MKLVIAGTGPGNPELISFAAVHYAARADVIIMQKDSIAESVIREYITPRNVIYITFPMVYNSSERDNEIYSQLQEHRAIWDKSSIIFFPVLGDAVLYSTGQYLLGAFTKIYPSIESIFIPGISAHSVACACAHKFLAMRDEIFSVIPATAASEKISSVMNSSDVVAVYKPSANDYWKKYIPSFKNIFRVDYAGIPGKERMTYDLSEPDKYMSIVIMQK